LKLGQPDLLRDQSYDSCDFTPSRRRIKLAGSRDICLLITRVYAGAPIPGGAAHCSRSIGSGQISQPAVDLLLGFVALNAVTFLDPADELGAFALDQIEIVVGELALLLLHFAFYLLPVSFYAIPVHRVSCLAGAVGRFAFGRLDSTKRQGVAGKNPATPRVAGRARGEGDAAGRSYKPPRKNRFRGLAVGRARRLGQRAAAETIRFASAFCFAKR
jgi:hypothetical protein